MSKIGKLLIQIPSGTTVKLKEGHISVAGPKGELSWQLPELVEVKIENDTVQVLRQAETKLAKSLHGMTRSKLANMVKGVSESYTKILDVFGVGYRVEVKDDRVILNIGFSHPVALPIIPGTEIKVTKNEVSISGIDKEAVGEMAARIRAQKPPEPYKGKGIKYRDEIVRRKAGKAAKTAAQ